MNPYSYKDKIKILVFSDSQTNSQRKLCCCKQSSTVTVVLDTVCFSNRNRDVYTDYIQIN